MPRGAGQAPAGVSPAGFGAPDVAPSAVAGALLVDAYDGTPREARKIDQRSRQYVFDANGRVQGMRGVYQLVQLRLLTVRNSSALKDFGLSLTSVQVIGANHQRQVEDIFNVALKDLLDARLIAIVAVKIDRFSPTGDYITLQWRDLTLLPAVEFASKV